MKFFRLIFILALLSIPGLLLAGDFGKANVYADGAYSLDEECPPSVCTLSSGASGFDVGTASGGSSCFDSYGGGDYIVHASGKGIKGTADGFHYLACEETGDIDLIVRVTKIQKNSSRQAGLMLSDCIAPDAMNVALVINGTKQIKLTTRSTTGGTTTTIATAAAPKRKNMWLRLIRTGNNVFAYYSKNGTIWNLVATSAVNFTPDPYAAGMVASKGASGNATKEFRFDNFSGASCSFSHCSAPPRLADQGSMDLTLKGYPNPFSHQLSYRVAGITGEGQVLLTDLAGRTIRTESVNVADARYEGKMETSDLAPGVYILVVKIGEQRKMIKVVKQ